MPRYRQRPAEVTAEQYKSLRRLPAGASVYQANDGPSVWIDLNYDGSMYGIDRGCWIVTWPDGRRSAITDEQFKARFELVEDSP